MSTRLFDRDPLLGLTRLFHYDDETDTFTIETIHQSNLDEANRAIFNEFDERSPWKGELHRVASIPLNIYWEMHREGKLDDQRYLKRWLNDPDNRVFRTRPGAV